MKHMKREAWIKIIDEWTKSGLTKAAFCREKGLGKESFYKWIKLLEGEVPQKSANNSSFLEIALPSFPEPGTQASRTLRILTSYGVTLEIPL